VEQAMKNCEGEKRPKKNAPALPLFQFAPSYWGHMPFCPPPPLRPFMLWP